MNECQPTASITMSVNLDSRTGLPIKQFDKGFKPERPPDESSYNYHLQWTIYDSFSEDHTLSLYFRKTDQIHIWQLFIGVDGWDVNPTPVYTMPRPYTLVFSQDAVLRHQGFSTSPKYYSVAPVEITYRSGAGDATLPQKLTLNLSNSSEFASDLAILSIYANDTTGSQWSDSEINDLPSLSHSIAYLERPPTILTSFISQINSNLNEKPHSTEKRHSITNLDR